MIETEIEKQLKTYLETPTVSVHSFKTCIIDYS